MLDLSLNTFVTALVGAFVVFVLTSAAWSIRRTFHRQDRDIENQDRKIEKQDREIEKMADARNMIGEKLAGVLEREKELSSELKSGMEKVDLKFENMGLTFKHETDVIRKDMAALATNMDKDIQGLRHSFNEMKASVGAHDKVVDKDLAEIREWLKGDGTWPSRSNGKG